MLEQTAQRGCGCPIPGGVQGQDGWSFELPSLVESFPVHAGELEQNDLYSYLQLKPFHDFTMLWELRGLDTIVLE